MSYYSDEASIHAQMYEDKIDEMENKAHYIKTAYKQGFLEWESKQGKILVNKMGISHILNSIRMLKKNDSDVAKAWIKVFEIELNKRSEV